MNQALDPVRTLAIKLYEAGQKEKRSNRSAWGNQSHNQRFSDLPSETVAVWDAVALAAIEALSTKQKAGKQPAVGKTLVEVFAAEAEIVKRCDWHNDIAGCDKMAEYLASDGKAYCSEHAEKYSSFGGTVTPYNFNAPTQNKKSTFKSIPS